MSSETERNKRILLIALLSIGIFAVFGFSTEENGMKVYCGDFGAENPFCLSILGFKLYSVYGCDPSDLNCNTQRDDEVVEIESVRYANHSPETIELWWSYQSSSSVSYCNTIPDLPTNYVYLYEKGDYVCMEAYESNTNVKATETGWFIQSGGDIHDPYDTSVQPWFITKGYRATFTANEDTRIMAIDCTGLDRDGCIDKHGEHMSGTHVDIVCDEIGYDYNLETLSCEPEDTQTSFLTNELIVAGILGTAVIVFLYRRD